MNRYTYVVAFWPTVFVKYDAFEGLKSFFTFVLLADTVANCGPLIVMNPGPGNLRLDQSDGTFFNNVTTYTCDEGYNVIGDMTRVCMADEMWSGMEPVCERKSE